MAGVVGNPIPMIAFETGWLQANLKRAELTVESLASESGVSERRIRYTLDGQPLRVTLAIKLLDALQNAHERNVRETENAGGRRRRREKREMARRRALAELPPDAFMFDFDLTG